MQAIELLLLNFCDCRMLPSAEDADPYTHRSTCLYRKIFDMLLNGDTDREIVRELIRFWHFLVWIKGK